MEKETLRNEIEEAMLTLSKSPTLNRVAAYMEGEGAVLIYLVHCDKGTIPSVISDDLGLSRARITNILNALRQKGLVELSIDENDRRKTIATVTEKGYQYVIEKINIKESIFDMLYEKLGEEKLKAFLELIQGVSEIFEKADREGVNNE